jgi:hypothetical protein
MEDRELPRLTNILERLAYEEDVRKILKILMTSTNEIDKKHE